MASEKVKRKTSIGGQALIEGVMMRGPKKTAMAVRHTSGEIATDEWDNDLSKRGFLWKIPFVRGTPVFIETMIFGFRCLMKSAEMSGLDEMEADETTDTAVTAEEEITNSDDDATEKQSTVEKNAMDENKVKDGTFLDKYGMPIAMVLGTVLGLGIAVGLFMFLPTFLVDFLSKIVPPIAGGFLRSLCEGVLRIILFVGYVVIVSFMKEIRRVFQYHGAEHKTIFCYEKGLDLTVENTRKQSRFHPRCGTSFIVFSLIIGIFTSMFIPTVFNPAMRSLIKILLLPVVVGIGYEIIKLAGKSDNAVVKFISKPGLWLQKITTKEPTDDMLEIAIVAMKKVIPEKGEDIIG